MHPSRRPAPPRRTARSTAEAADAPKKAPARLDPTQQVLVAEALRRAELTRNVVEDALVDLGRWLLIHVFDDDAAAALDKGKRRNPVWSDLWRRAGGPTLRLSRRTLHVAVTIAAHDKRIQDDAWRLLEPGRKEILLPLGDSASLREAAQRAVAMKLTQRDTRAYVRARLAVRGEGKDARVTVSQVRAGLRKLRERWTPAASVQKLRRQLAELPARDREAARAEFNAMRAWLDRLLGER